MILQYLSRKIMHVRNGFLTLTMFFFYHIFLEIVTDFQHRMESSPSRI